MTTVLLLLGFAVMAVMFYVAHLVWQTHPSNRKARAAMERTYGLGMLMEIEGPTKDYVRNHMTRQQKRNYSRMFMEGMMPKIYAEAQLAVRASRHPMALWHFGVFHVIYRIVEFKIRYAARVEDMRYLIGAEASVMRSAARVG